MIQIHQSIYEMARNEARGSFQRDIAYRLWNAQNGGVYAPVNKMTPPNPYLKNIKERDIVTPDGRHLTLINPAYMTRQVHELARKHFGIISHITSLKPIRPANKADAWETEALKKFEMGKDEVFSTEKIGDGEYVRLMRPLKTEQACLQCHAAQGYKVGDIRGGISIAISTDPLKAIARKQVFQMVGEYAILWLIGIGGIIFGTNQLKKSGIKRDNIETDLRRTLKQKETLMREMHHRVKNNLAIVSALLSIQSRRISDPNTKKIFNESQSQIQTIAKLHEFFYRSNAVELVDMKKYLQNVIDNLNNFFEIDFKKIKVSTDIDPIEVNSKCATYCGLILNELFTNAFKYGRNANDEGEIQIKFKKQSETGEILLAVHNSGKSLPENFDLSELNSMGLQLVTMLANQLEGKLSIFRENGTTFQVQFSNS
ncbi:MAG: DUF3365 domain-containing protein [Calditrichaeota bacterium]|nr:DUF3365 domain-containing protein [Calditrichota bacterium]